MFVVSVQDLPGMVVDKDGGFRVEGDALRVGQEIGPKHRRQRDEPHDQHRRASGGLVHGISASHGRSGTTPSLPV